MLVYSITATSSVFTIIRYPNINLHIASLYFKKKNKKAESKAEITAEKDRAIQRTLKKKDEGQRAKIHRTVLDKQPDVFFEEWERVVGVMSGGASEA